MNLNVWLNRRPVVRLCMSYYPSVAQRRGIGGVSFRFLEELFCYRPKGLVNISATRCHFCMRVNVLDTRIGRQGAKRCYCAGLPSTCTLYLTHLV